MIFIWGMTHILGNTECKLVYYIHRLAQSLSFCTTCLLSSFQEITISPRTGGWMRLKDRAWKNILSSCFLCWISNLLINVFVPINLEAYQHTHNSIKLWDYGLCSLKNPEMSSAAKYTIIMTFPDAVFMGLVTGASVYMVLLLHRPHPPASEAYSHPQKLPQLLSWGKSRSNRPASSKHLHFVLLHQFSPYNLSCFFQVSPLGAAYYHLSSCILSLPEPPDIVASRSPSTKILLLNIEKILND